MRIGGAMTYDHRRTGCLPLESGTEACPGATRPVDTPERADQVDLLEYQGKQLLATAGLPVVSSEVAATPTEAVAAASRLGYPVAVKAQVPVGGRGKAGGIRVVTTAGDCEGVAEAILSMSIGGHRVRRLLVEAAVDIDSEWYVAVTFDRAARAHAIILSAEGGIDIEAVAAERPEALSRVHVDAEQGLTAEQLAELIRRSGIADGAEPEVVDALEALIELTYRAYVEADAELIEINPLVLTAGGELVALDAKVTLDDNAAFRHPERQAWADAEPGLDSRETRARERGLNYVGLDGTVGVIGNGAGLVMSSLDVVARAGGAAANFLDIGGGASAQVMTEALELVGSDPKVGAIFVNIFGGITRGDEVARGIIEAMSSLDLPCPLVVRLDGTNAEEGRALLAGHESDRLRFRPTMAEAAALAVALAGPPKVVAQ